jgi:sirohydrochlorin cobaltochelatase
MQANASRKCGAKTPVLPEVSSILIEVFSMSRETGLILFSHGSLLCDAGRNLDEHVDRLRELGEFAEVRVGYLNYTDPPIETSVQGCIESGIKRIRVVPWFLVAGKFVRVDLPERLKLVRETYPGIDMEVTVPVGQGSDPSELIVMAANGAVGWSERHSLPAALGRRCGANPQCPDYDTQWCKMMRSGQESVTRETPSPRAQPVGVSPEDVLVVLAHGSPRSTTVAEVEKPACQAAGRLGLSWHRAGFLDCNSPDIPTAVASALNEVAARRAQGQHNSCVVIVPFFLHAGKHVANDMPQLIGSVVAPHQESWVRLAPHLGALPLLSEFAQRAALR